MAYLNRTASYVRAALASVSLLLASQIGCSSTVDEQIELAQLAQNCLVNSDCLDPLVCAFEACHTECVSSRDCDDGARCVAAARPYKVCQLESERDCERLSDCAAGLVCGIDGECRDQCVTDNDCVQNQRCVSGTCADADELDQDGQLTTVRGASSGSEGSPCVYVSDCSEALLCRNQACLPECKADKDCAAHQLCQDTRCVADGSEPVACNYSSDCVEDGKLCLGGGCRCSCVEDRDCPSAQRCDKCGCVPDPDAPPSCIYNSDCKVPGAICRERVCDCECKADADCGEGSKCDGCGCVEALDPIDGVVFGRVSVVSSLHLSLYRGVREIRGDLFIEGPAIADLGDTFDELRQVDGMIWIETDHPLLQGLSFPSLERANLVHLTNLSALTELDLPRLRDTYLELGNLQRLDTLDVGALETGSVLLYGLPVLDQLLLPKVTKLYGLTLSNMTLLETLELPLLQTISHAFSVGYDTFGDPEVPLPMPMLSTLSAPALTMIGDNGPYSGSVLFAGSKLVTLASVGAANLAVNAQDVKLIGNTLLGDCQAKAFVDRCRAGGLVDNAIVKIADNLADGCTDAP